MIKKEIREDEEIVIESLRNKLKHIDFLVPTKQIQKGFDFVMYSASKDYFLKVQVKGSRVYENGFLWFKVFDLAENVDYFVFTGSYYKYKATLRNGRLDRKIDNMILIFSREEIKRFFDNNLKKKTDEQDNQFYIRIENENEVYWERGRGNSGKDLSDYLLKNKLKEIEEKIS